MLHKLAPKNYDLLLKYPNFAVFPMIHAVCLQLQSGHIFIDDMENPKVIFVINKPGFAHLFTHHDFNEYEKLLDFFRTEPILPEYFHVFCPGPKLLNKLSINDNVGFKLRNRCQFKYNKNTNILPSIPIELQPIRVEEINAHNIDDLKKMGPDFVIKWWDSETQYLKDGFGVIVYNANREPISVCSTTCVVDNIAELEIFTNPDYRGKGIAKYAAGTYVNMCLQRGFIGLWDCYKDNLGSYKGALASGFEISKEYTFLSLYLKNKAINSVVKN